MKKLGLFLLDITALYGALALTILVRYRGEFWHQYNLHVLPFSIIFIVWLLVLYISNLYDTQSLRNNLDFFSNLSRALVIASAVSIAFFYLTDISGITPKRNLFLFIFIFAGIEIIFRSSFNNILETKFKKRTVIVGVDPQSRELARFIKENPQHGYHLLYVVDTNPQTLESTTTEFQEFGILQGIKNLERVIKEEKVDVVVISPDAYQMQELINVFYKAIDQQVNFYNLASFYEKLTGKVPLGAINQIWFLENLAEGTKKAYKALKRTVDIFLAILLGLVTLTLTPLLALGIKLTSPGPVLYRQKRVGRGGKPFKLIKFRSMVVNAEEKSGAVWARENDPRITVVGKFLRKTRLDEFPQFWNVLKGELSFVGPRAERPEFHDKLKQEMPFYEERYLVTPGITGPAQLQRSYYASVADTREKLQYDLYYVKNRSLLLDLGILLKTLNVMIRGLGR